MTQTGTPPDNEPNLTVYFDGGCPLCRREISMYRGMKGADRIAWVDVAGEGTPMIGGDLSKCDALRRFHVRRKDGQLASGAVAFAELWKALPTLSFAGRIMALPGIHHVAEIVYRLFLNVRPFVQRIVPR